MVELVNFLGGRVVELYNKMWQVLAERKSISVDEARRTHEVRALWAEDFDDRRESDYILLWGSYDGDHVVNQEMFAMQPVQRFEIVGFYGWCNGNAGRTINSLKVWIDNVKVREFPGIFLSSEMNDSFIFDDPFFALKTQNLRIIPNTTGAAAYTRAFPLGFGVATPRGEAKVKAR